MSNDCLTKSTITKADKGAAAELLVCADLIMAGYDVFRNVSPNGEWDLFIYKRYGKEWDAWPIQVKSGWSERKYVNPHIDAKGRRMIMAVVQDGKITYDPPPVSRHRGEIGPDEARP